MQSGRAASLGDAGPDPVSHVVEVVIARLIETDALQPATLVEFGEEMRKLARFSQSLGAVRIEDVSPEIAGDFVRALRSNGSTPSPATMHVRRGAIRLLFREARNLGLATGDPTLDLHLPPRSSLKARPLTDDEVDLGRAYALDSVTAFRRVLAWALSEATGRTNEIHRVVIRDVDLDGRRVYLHGSPQADPRWGRLTEWAAMQIERRLLAQKMPSRPDSRLIIWRSKEPSEPRAAASMAVLETLRAAGLRQEPDVRPRSIPAWAGACMLREGHPIDEVARALGCRSLDQAAELVALDWRAKDRAKPRDA